MVKGNYWHFLTTSSFTTLYFLNWCPIFDDSTLHICPLTKYNNFLRSCWFSAKNLSNFVSLPYCQNLETINFSSTQQFPNWILNFGSLWYRAKEEKRLAAERDIEFSPQELALATVPGMNFDPRDCRFSPEELRPQPIIRKRKKVFANYII